MRSKKGLNDRNNAWIWLMVRKYTGQILLRSPCEWIEILEPFGHACAGDLDQLSSRRSTRKFLFVHLDDIGQYDTAGLHLHQFDLHIDVPADDIIETEDLGGKDKARSHELSGFRGIAIIVHSAHVPALLGQQIVHALPIDQDQQWIIQFQQCILY